MFPKALSKRTQQLFERITKGVHKVGDHAKLDKGKPYMPLVIECIDQITEGSFNGTRMVSLAHYYEQNGDLMADPEVCFYVFATGKVFPYYYRQDALGMEKTYMTIEDEKIKFNAHWQADLVSFCNDWFKNIIEQNEIPK